MLNDKLRIKEVKEGRTELTVKHNGQDLTFIHPAYGPDTYATVGRLIEENGLIRPTMAQTASLVHTVFDRYEDIYDFAYDNEYAINIRKIMRKLEGLWAFTGSLYVPKKGVYVQDNPEIRDGIPFMDESELIRKLEANDPSVRFVPFNRFNIGKMTASKLLENEYLIALVGEEGSEKLAEVAGKFKYNPYLWGLAYSYNVQEPFKIRVSSISILWDELLWKTDENLHINGAEYPSSFAAAFGIQKKNNKTLKSIEK